ncbi:hypothetical protein KXV79_006957 [Aspergillus fumigatus]|nr:hypothetical protein KXX66_006044 [Aspergillus fumigatus]KAH1705442.1 hypothetical protein KXX24_006048 [Aspergillus fumigatus]KAH1784626.1 hypothetical protein KXX62_006931 [Aspergillus fumigatus]KAH2141982.1 hypothetical protein KXV35_003615 [Aspergillus fumigatus]KAH2580616.1 hypothetical protein KXV42_006968 [Aspergillus fumigatus]
MSPRCRPVSSESVSFDRQSFLNGRKTYHGNVRNTNTGLSVPLSSDESSIYNAARAASVDDCYSLTCSTDNPMDEILDRGMAPNLAMFIPLAHEAHACHSLYLSKEQMIKGPLWDSLPLSDTCVAAIASCDEKSEHVLSDVSLKKHSRDKSRQRKVASLNDLDNIQRIPKWPGSKRSPVRPAFPRFPPPYRSPTPPGLPSFGSPEAISYSTQFFVRSLVREGHIQQRPPPATGPPTSNGGGVASYGESLRRFFGFSSPAPPRPTGQSIPVARAGDGTAVLGRFPYRHSAHGTSLVRPLDDHPFHRRALPAADCETVEEESDSNRPNEYSTRLVKYTNLAQVEASVPTPRPAEENRRFDSSSVTPAIPKQTVTGRSRNTGSATVSLAKNPIHRQTSISQTLHGRTSLSGNEPQQQSSDRIGEPRLSVEMTGTVPGSADTLLQFLKARALPLCCCLPGFGEQDDIIYAQSSNDTYTTARSSPGNGIDSRV